jgi:outer membrane receptor protein involved in Fe transport
MNLKLVTAFVFALLLAVVSFPQTKTYTGTVSDSLTADKLPGVNVVSITKEDSTVYTGAATDADGKFILKVPVSRDVFLRVSMVGYKTRDIELPETKDETELGNILLSQSAVTLSDIEVRGVKPMLEYEVGKVVVNIDKVPGNTSSVSDALKNTGLIDVDPQSKKISVRGSSAVNIMIDGRPVPMADELLSQMPASYIEKAEITTVPSAKEDPEGAAGILNIITKKNTSDNYNGSVSLSGSTQKFGYGNIMLNYKKGSFNVNGGFMGFMGSMANTMTSRRINNNSSSLHYINTASESNFDPNMKGFNLGLDYDPDTVNNFSVTGSYNQMKFSGKSDAFAGNYDENYLPVYNYLQISERDIDFKSYTYTAYYRRKFDQKGHELTADAYYLKQDNTNNTGMSTAYNYLAGYPELQETDRHEKNNTVILKTDYVNPSETIGKFEAGYRFTFRDRENVYENSNFSYPANSWIDSLSLGNTFKYKEIINAAYLTYSQKIYVFDVKAGLRLEQTLTEGDQVKTHEVFKSDYTSLFPSLNVAYKLTDLYQLSFNAARRITRPVMDQINPFTFVTAPNQVFRGNQKIEPTYTNVFEIGLSTLLKFYYNDTKGRTTSFTTVESDTISVSTWINSIATKTYGAEFNMPIMNGPTSPVTLPDWLTMININASYQYMTEEAGYMSDDYNISRNVYRLGGNLNLKLWYDVDASFYISYNPKQRDDRFVTKSTTYAGLSFSKNYFDRKLNISLFFNDLFNSSQFSTETITDAFYSSLRYAMHNSRSVGISVRYSFNDFKMKNERTVDDGRDRTETPGGM